MSDTTPQAKGYYENYWSTGKDAYSGSVQGYAPAFRRWMAAELGDLPPDSPIIEVGCGDATFTSDLAKFSRSVTAIDISAGQIEQNTGKFPAIRFLQHDVSERFPFADASFEVAWCSEVLEHLFDPAFAVREMHRILKPGGRLLVTVPYHGLLKNVLIALFKWDKHFTPSNPHIRFFSKHTLEKVARNAGFEVLRTGSCGIGKPLRDLFVPTNLLMRAEKKGAAASS